MTDKKQKAFKQLSNIQALLSEVEVFPSLAWLWCFDVIKDIYDNHQFEHATTSDYEAIAEGVTLEQIFNKFFDDADNLGITMDLGGEIIEETIMDWMRDNDFLVALDEDSWLDQEDED